MYIAQVCGCSHGQWGVGRMQDPLDADRSSAPAALVGMDGARTFRDNDARFDAADTDADGVLSRQEFAQHSARWRSVHAAGDGGENHGIRAILQGILGELQALSATAAVVEGSDAGAAPAEGTTEAAEVLPEAAATDAAAGAVEVTGADGEGTAAPAVTKDEVFGQFDTLLARLADTAGQDASPESLPALARSLYVDVQSILEAV